MENCDSKGFKLLRIVNNKEDSQEFFQSKDIINTRLYHGWQSSKCKNCEIQEKKYIFFYLPSYNSTQNNL
jgi:hypothetical protein